MPAEHYQERQHEQHGEGAVDDAHDAVTDLAAPVQPAQGRHADRDGGRDDEIGRGRAVDGEAEPAAEQHRTEQERREHREDVEDHEHRRACSAAEVVAAEKGVQRQVERRTDVTVENDLADRQLSSPPVMVRGAPGPRCKARRRGRQAGLPA